MTPAVTALVEFSERMARELPMELRERLEGLCRDARAEDPLTVAFEQAQARFRSREQV